MSWVRTARLGKAKRPIYPGAKPDMRIVVEIVEMPASDIPPGAGFPTRHEAVAASKRKRPPWADDA